jgi:hypothetical protein
VQIVVRILADPRPRARVPTTVRESLDRTVTGEDMGQERAVGTHDGSLAS